MVNREGRALVRGLREIGWSIMNGNMKGKEGGEWTYTGAGENSVIDYVIGDERVKERVEELRVGDQMESNHQPLVIKIREEGRKKIGGRGGVRGSRDKWDEEGRNEFKSRLGGV